MHLTKLKPKKKLARKNIATLDVETRDGLAGCDFFCGSVCYIQKSRHPKISTFFDSFELFDFCFGQFKSGSLIFIQNLDFEFRFILQWVVARKYEWKVIESGKLIQCSIETEEKTLIFRDSFQWLQSDQESAEITYDIPAEFRKIDCSKIFDTAFSLWTDNDKQTVVDHNRNDVRALYEILQKIRITLFDLTGLDFLRYLTPSSFAVAALRTNLETGVFNAFVFEDRKTHEKKLLHEEIFRFILKTYYGGRTEIFGNPTLGQTCVKIDINSQYPFCLYKHNYPGGKFFEIKNPTAADIEKYTNLLGFVDCTISVDKIQYPVLPLRIDSKLIFPVGRFRTQVTTEELKYALTRGYEIVEIHKLIYFEQKINPFRQYVQKFYSLKNKSTGGKKQLAKILLNSLTGKFGQKIDRVNREYKPIQTTDIYEQLEQQPEVCVSKIDDNAFQVIENEYRSLHAYNLPHIVAYITSYSRIYLHELITSAETVYYCDTDSLIIPNENLDKLSDYLDNKILGMLKVESKGYFHGWAPKCYVFYDIQYNSWDLKFKGVPKRILKKIEIPADFQDAIREIHEFLNKGVEYEQYCKYKTAIRKNKSLVSAIWSKELSLKDRKRKWLDEYESEPLWVSGTVIDDWIETVEDIKPKLPKIKEYKKKETKEREFMKVMQEYFPDLDNIWAYFDPKLEVSENVRQALNEIRERY
jgi:hypothetical protein